MSAMVSPRSKAVILMRPRCSGVTSTVSRAVKGVASGAPDAAFSGARTHASASPGRAAKSRLAAGAHRASLSISAASAVISRAAGPSPSISQTSRPLRAASAKTTRWPTVAAEAGGSWSVRSSACLARDDRARGAAVEDEAGDELRAKDRALP